MTHRGTVRLCALASALALGAASGLAQAGQVDDVFTGVWVLDSDARPDGVARQVLTIAVQGDEETYRSELTTADGRRQVTDYVARYDGVEYSSVTRLSGGGEPEDARPGGVILHRTDDLTRERHWKQDGRVFRILRRTVSADGCVMSSLLINVAPDGAEAPGGILRFTRQDPACQPLAAPFHTPR